MRLTVQYIQQNNLTVRHVFIANEELVMAIKNGFHHQVWRVNPLIAIIDNLMRIMGDVPLHYIPRSWAKTEIGLEIHGASLHELTL